MIRRAWASRSLPTSILLGRLRFYSSKRLPLEGIKVVDISRVLAGPYCTQILGDLGADVIKIEHPTRGDDTRAWGPPFADRSDGEGHGESAYFLCVNRNKKSLGLNFQDQRGQEILKRLIKDADVLVENFVPGTLAKYGLSYDDVRHLNDKIIYTSITGYGQSGPYMNRPGYDVMVEAEFGLMHITGEHDGPPVKVGVAVTDMTTGLYASNAIMASLISRSVTGKGQHLDVCLSDCQTATLANIASSCLISGRPDNGRWGTAHASIVPYQAFETKGGGSIVIGGGNDNLFGHVCDAVGAPEWKTDERFLTNALRVKNRDVLIPLLTEITKQKTSEEWLQVFEGRPFPYAAVNDVLTTLNHPQTLARNMVVTVDHPTCGPIKLLNSPVKFSETQPGIRSAPPVLGQHSHEVLRSLGYSDADLHALEAEGVVSSNVVL